MATAEDVFGVAISAFVTGVFWAIIIDHFGDLATTVTSDAVLVYLTALSVFLAGLTLLLVSEVSDGGR